MRVGGETWCDGDQGPVGSFLPRRVAAARSAGTTCPAVQGCVAHVLLVHVLLGVLGRRLCAAAPQPPVLPDARAKFLLLLVHAGLLNVAAKHHNAVITSIEQTVVG